MRSRYSAFVAADGEYLARTLHPEHPDASMPAEELARALRSEAQGSRFLGLTILATDAEGDRAWVAFHAKVFTRGVDRSFLERSEFRRHGGELLYVGGELSPHPARAPLPAGISPRPASLQR
jgi:SEC-C motif-containing protein